MSYLATLELIASLTVQVTVLIGAASVISRRRHLSANADRCWAIAHVCILLVTAAAIFAPHIRLTTWATLHPGVNYPPNGSTLSYLGALCMWFWPAGGIVVLTAGIIGMFKATSLVRAATLAPALRDRLAPSHRVHCPLKCEFPNNLLEPSAGRFTSRSSCCRMRCANSPRLSKQRSCGTSWPICGDSTRSTYSCSEWSRQSTGSIHSSGGLRVRPQPHEKSAAIATRWRVAERLPFTSEACFG